MSPAAAAAAARRFLCGRGGTAFVLRSSSNSSLSPPPFAAFASFAAAAGSSSSNNPSPTTLPFATAAALRSVTTGPITFFPTPFSLICRTQLLNKRDPSGPQSKGAPGINASCLQIIKPGSSQLLSKRALCIDASDPKTNVRRTLESQGVPSLSSPHVETLAVYLEAKGCPSKKAKYIAQLLLSDMDKKEQNKTKCTASDLRLAMSEMPDIKWEDIVDKLEEEDRAKQIEKAVYITSLVLMVFLTLLL